MGLILFILSIIISGFTYPIAFIYMLIKYIFQLRFLKILKRFDRLFYVIAYSIDQLGNVVLGDLMNDTLIKRKYKIPNEEIIILDEDLLLQTKEGYIEVNRFGDPDQTISAALGYNKNINNLTKLGKIISNILDKFDPNHCIKAAKIDQQRKIIIKS